MLTRIEKRQAEEMLSSIRDYETRINKEKTPTPYPEQEFDVFNDSFYDDEDRNWARNYPSIADRVADVEESIIENMHKNSVRAVDRAIDYIECWVPDYSGPIVDEAVVNIKRRIKAGIIVKPPRPPPKRLTYKEVRERYSSTFTEQEEP